MTDHKTVFVTHVLKGVRFDDHSVPVDVLVELNAYRDLIAEVARALFLRDNPDRVRVPKGFEESFQLSLKYIGEGSAAPELLREVTRRDAPQLQMFDGTEPAVEDYFEHAREEVDRCIEAVGAGQAPPADFPKHALIRFNTFGRRLRDGESIEIRKPGKTKGVRYDPTIRKRLVLAGGQPYTDNVELSGRICMEDAEKSSFELLTDDGTRVLGHFTEAQRPVVQRGIAGFERRVQVKVTGTGSFDAMDTLRAFETVEDISIVEDDENIRLDIEARIAELSHLSEGWLDGAGAALDPAGLAGVSQVLKAIVEHYEKPRPYLYPTPDGGVQAEWSVPDWELAAEFGLPAGPVELIATHLRSGASTEEKFEIRDEHLAQHVAEFIGKFQTLEGTL